MRKVFIQTNDKQLLGAELARFAILRGLKEKGSVEVELLNVDGMAEFKAFAGKRYKRGGLEMTYDPADLQSFTLSRFMPPERMGWQGRAVVIDPDIFCLTDIGGLFETDLGGAAVAACRKKDAWDTSVMLLDCAKLRHWKIGTLLEGLGSGRADYADWMTLKKETAMKELPRLWNNLDRLTPETRMLHTTGRLTQPWKTGLPIDFRRNPLPKIFGLVPREWLHRLMGKYPTRYQPHPDKDIEKFFFKLLADGLEAGAVSERFVKDEIAKKNVRPDIFTCLAATRSNG
jgi:hypothetical protein